MAEKEYAIPLVRNMRWQRMEIIENRMVVDSQWTNYEEDKNLPFCECCEERIKQFRALHILYGKKRVWICDRCIEDMKEVTGW